MQRYLNFTGIHRIRKLRRNVKSLLRLIKKPTAWPRQLIRVIKNGPSLFVLRSPY